MFKTMSRHVVLTDKEWRCMINALDVLEVIVKGDELDSSTLNELRNWFPPTAIEDARAKLV